MEDLLNSWSERIQDKCKDLGPDEKHLVAVAGIPGAGKSTFARGLVETINKNSKSEKDIAVLIGLDGWHFSRAELDKFPDPAEAYRRRGAAFTFDGKLFSEFITELCVDHKPNLAAPSFAHELKDPVYNAIKVEPHHKIIVFEGLYLLLDLLPWSGAAKFFNEKFFIDIERSVARERLIHRHVQTGVCPNMEEAIIRAETSDLVNGDEIIANLDKEAIRIKLPELINS